MATKRIGSCMSFVSTTVLACLPMYVNINHCMMIFIIPAACCMSCNFSRCIHGWLCCNYFSSSFVANSWQLIMRFSGTSQNGTAACGLLSSAAARRDWKVSIYIFLHALVQDDGGWVVCRVFKKTKNFKMKTSCSDERAVSFEGQFGLMPENIMSSPEILSGSVSYNPGSLLDFPAAAAACKQEINLDTYNNVVVPSAYHSDPFNAQLAQLAMNKLDCCNHAAMQQPAHELSSGSFHEGQLVGRDISCRSRDTTGSFFTEQYAATTLENDHHVDSPASTCFFPEAAHCSSSHCNPEEGFLAAYDDSWATTLYESKAGYKDLLRFPTSTAAVRAAAAGAADQSLGDVHILFQLRRQQHSDLIFPSSCVEQLDNWNFNQIYNQKML